MRIAAHSGSASRQSVCEAGGALCRRSGHFIEYDNEFPELTYVNILAKK
jgi:hypothetical protein